MNARRREITDEEAAQKIARALADPHRYQIAKALANCEQSKQCAFLRDTLDITPQTVSHHMKELREAGLIEVKRTGRTVGYNLRRDIVEAFLNVLERDLLPPAPEP